MHARHSLPNQFSGGSSFLQDLAYSAQQALNQSPHDDVVPVDPALQAYANDNYQEMDMAPPYHQNGDDIMSSIEYQNGGPVPMDGIVFGGRNGELHGPSVEPLTPGPPPHSDTIHVRTNGVASKPVIELGSAYRDAVRHPSSPVSPRHISAASPTPRHYDHYITSPATNNYNNNFTTNSDFPPPPVTPSANPVHASRGPHSLGRKTSHTPSRGGRNSKTPKSTPGGRIRDSKDSIKVEQGLSVGMLGMIDPNLDQASIDLIKQLQQEDLGLRRRSR